VLGELASFSGDANHRLVAHGLRVLARRLPPVAVRVRPPAPTAVRVRFHEVSPSFTLPNALANAAVLAHHQASSAPRSLHVVDLGVSHGVQWPTLLESLITPHSAPFSLSPLGYDFRRTSSGTPSPSTCRSPSAARPPWTASPPKPRARCSSCASSSGMATRGATRGRMS
jgi:hypothetical protein